jgi:hypothetical protein
VQIHPSRNSKRTDCFYRFINRLNIDIPPADVLLRTRSVIVLRIMTQGM